MCMYHWTSSYLVPMYLCTYRRNGLRGYQRAGIHTQLIAIITEYAIHGYGISSRSIDRNNRIYLEYRIQNTLRWNKIEVFTATCARRSGGQAFVIRALPLLAELAEPCLAAYSTSPRHLSPSFSSPSSSIYLHPSSITYHHYHHFPCVIVKFIAYILE